MAKTLFWGIPMRYALYVGSGLVGMVVGGIIGGLISVASAMVGSIIGYLVGSYAGWIVYEKFR